jgi:hypothetical protein
MAENHFKIREVVNDVIKGIGVDIPHLCPFEEACPGMEENGKSLFLAPLIDGVEKGIVGKEHPVSRMDLEAACPLVKLLLKSGHGVGLASGVQIGDGDKLRMKGIYFVRPFEGHDARCSG